MLLYLFAYLTAAILVFQGTQVLGEQREPLGVVPGEVAQEPGRAGVWGGFLVTAGALSIAFALLSHGFFPLRPFVARVLGLDLLVMAAYGFYVIFLNRKVAYLGKPAADHGHGHH